MFVVTINNIDSSCHSLLGDAQAQQERFEAKGATNVAIVEKDTFAPTFD